MLVALSHKLWFGRALAAVGVLEPDDVVEVRRRDLQDRRVLQGRHTVYTAGAYAILLHEALHRQGVKNERITTCLSNEAVRWGALWHGFSEAQALRARNLAFAYTRLFSPPDYYLGKPDCLVLTRRKDWPAFR